MTINNRFFAFYLLLLLGLAVILSGLPLDTAQAAPPAQAPDVPPAIAGGRGLWPENCRPCHGPAGKGDGPTAAEIEGHLPDLSDPEAARQRMPIDIFNVIKDGRTGTLMPPWSDRLNDAQIWDATAYVWSLGANPQDIEAGKTLYLEQCSVCHGEDGTGNDFAAAADVADFTDLQVMVQQSQIDLQAGFAAGSKHGELLDTLSEEEQWQVLDYIRSLSFVLPQRNGMLTGQVINGSTDQSVGNIEVTLHALSGETEVEKFTAQTDSDGRYTFENLTTDHSMQYAVEGSYNDIVFMSEQPAVFPPGNTETTLDLIVYDTTSDDEAISISQFNYLIAFGPDSVQAVQIFVVSNSSNQVYTGQNGETFVFSLPSNAESEVFDGDFGGRFVKRDGGYADSLPIRPGQDSHGIHSRYLIPFDGDSLTIEIPIPADIATANVLLQEIGASLSSDQLEFAETLEGHGDKFTIYAAENLSKGDTLTLELTDLDKLDFSAPPPSAENAGASANPSATTPEGQIDQNLLLWIVVGVGALAVVAVALVYPMLRPQLTNQPVATHYEDTETRRQKLMLMLVRLDETFEAGELDKAVYQQARAKYKAELARIMDEV